MPNQGNIYKTNYLQKAGVTFCILLFVALSTSAQQNNLNKNSNSKPLNPILYISFKTHEAVNQVFEEYIKPAKGELMYWPNYPLTAAQIESRNKEWDRKNNQSVGQQIAGNIAESIINNLIYGSKSPVAARPRF